MRCRNGHLADGRGTIPSELWRIPGQYRGMVRDSAGHSLQSGIRLEDRGRDIVIDAAAQRFFNHVDLDVGDRRLRPAYKGAISDQPLNPLRPARDIVGGQRLSRRLSLRRIGDPRGGRDTLAQLFTRIQHGIVPRRIPGVIWM